MIYNNSRLMHAASYLGYACNMQSMAHPVCVIWKATLCFALIAV